MSKRKIKVEVNTQTSFGSICLREFLPRLKEGDIIEGILDDRTNAIDFKLNGTDAMLWLGHNCIETKTKKKGINLKKKR